MTTTEQALWGRRFHPAPGGASRLICLPHAGGSAPFFLPVSQKLSARFDVVSVQYPGRQDRRHEPCVTDLVELARGVFEALGPWDGPPVALFGHSMGASLGFELARLMEAEAGVKPAHLFVSGRKAPSMPRDERVHLLNDAGLLADVRRLGGADPRILGDEELLRMALPAIRADYRAAETYVYRPGPPLSCPITAFTGDDDPKVTVEEARAWSAHTTGAFELNVFRGGHFFLAQHQAAILENISGYLSLA
ncbi:thioesterase [Spongiactinospora gelatinilytica]|uniref:Thioesterase n=1 Tax=Spongiactinospora gelatinilytica TaxID=2666298 RepID=A0A2W2GW72_9ACTN|nr:alpha/beta fold hydrolase [Spongiactinospora gelatinilytica]PZG51953.1 thioesterase [Spongiactinospora gelatinilytica]